QENNLTTWERWKTTPRILIRMIRFYGWLKSPANQKRMFSYREMRQILVQHTIFKKMRAKQDEMLYRDSLVGMSLKEISKKYMTTEEKAQNIIDRRGRDFSPQVFEMTEDFIKARLAQLTMDMDEARKVAKDYIDKIKAATWVDEEQIETSGGKFDGELKTKRRLGVNRALELYTLMLKQQLMLFEAVGQFVPKTNIIVNEGKELASLPHEQLVALIKVKERELRIPSENRVRIDAEQVTS
ncbi:MAG: hypothetical protein Q8O19_00465, partial [Rectinemataceae bacterium]|nr:hypothetical protein [Rectinemataceae bacterium]